MDPAFYSRNRHAQSKAQAVHRVADVYCLNTEGPSFSYFIPSFGEQTTWSFDDQNADALMSA
jgi:hypothetical protein